MENLLRAAENDTPETVDAVSVTTVEGVDFMIEDQSELVDLDALFDALNVAVKDGVDAMSYVGGENSGILTVTQDAFTQVAIALDDAGPSANSDDFIKDQIPSDES
jgi:hypothetical protein